MVARDGVEPFLLPCYQQLADSTICTIRIIRSAFPCAFCVRSLVPISVPTIRYAWLSVQISGSPLFCGRYRDSTLILSLSLSALGCECNHQQNLKTMRGAKSNALFLRRANWNRICRCVALVIRAMLGLCPSLRQLRGHGERECFRLSREIRNDRNANKTTHCLQRHADRHQVDTTSPVLAVDVLLVSLTLTELNRRRQPFQGGRNSACSNLQGRGRLRNPVRTHG
jgi:hypothetical protein